MLNSYPVHWDGGRLGRIRLVGTERRWVAMAKTSRVPENPNGCSCHANYSCSHVFPAGLMFIFLMVTESCNGHYWLTR
jgi:hypothetical protein